MSSRSVDLNKGCGKGHGKGHGKGRGKRERQGDGKSDSKRPQVYPWPQTGYEYGHWHGHGYVYGYGHMEGPVIHGYGAQVAGGGYAGPVAYWYGHGTAAHSRAYGYADTQRQDLTIMLNLPPALASGTRSSAARHAGEALFAAVRARMFKITVNVVRLSGDAILESMEIHTKDKVSVIKNKVEEALGACWAQQVDLVVKGRKLFNDQLIEDSGLVDGDTVTALLVKMPTRVWRYHYSFSYMGDTSCLENRVLLEYNGSCASISIFSANDDEYEYRVKLGTYIEEGSTVKITWACQVERPRWRSAWRLDMEGGQGKPVQDGCKDAFVVNRTGMSIKLDRQECLLISNPSIKRRLRLLREGSVIKKADRDLFEWCGSANDKFTSLHSCLTSLPELDQLLLLLEGEGFPHVVHEKTKREEE